ncbi:MAG: hypothetical protein ACE369_13215 [Roseovarius sp.]
MPLPLPIPLKPALRLGTGLAVLALTAPDIDGADRFDAHASFTLPGACAAITWPPQCPPVPGPDPAISRLPPP